MPLSPYLHAAQWAYLRAAGTAAAQAVSRSSIAGLSPPKRSNEFGRARHGLIFASVADGDQCHLGINEPPCSRAYRLPERRLTTSLQPAWADCSDR
jgi:hypothetical protein